MSQHKDFILSHSRCILEEASSAIDLITHEIEMYPLGEYLLQSIFMKLAGAQQQKMNCILWELGTDNYQFRYEHYIKNRYNIDECSTYTDKQAVYRVLLKFIKEKQVFDTSSTDIVNKKNDIINDVKTSIDIFAKQTNFNNLFSQIYADYQEIMSGIDCSYLMCSTSNSETIFDNSKYINGTDLTMKLIYEDHLYRHRNRCAHNTLSYQSNIPTLSMLETPKNRFNNYFLYFAILLLIDEIMIFLFTKYLDIRIEYA